MAGPSELKGFWRRSIDFLTSKKQRRTSQASQASSESSGGDGQRRMMLDEANVMITGLAMDTKLEAVCIEYASADPRFIGNPHGVGCSKNYELPYDNVMNPLSTSPASRQSSGPGKINVNENDGPSPFPPPGAPMAEGEDNLKGKRKGRMPGDSEDDRYKSLFDAAAKSSAKRFTRARQRASTR